MTTTDFTTSIQLEQTPDVVFAAVNNVRGWWSEEIEGSTDALHDVFEYHFQDVHRATIKITESVSGKKVTWFVVKNYFNFTSDNSEWTGTSISFDIDTNEGQTQLQFTHHGLVPQYQCYAICRDAWTNYIQNSLRNLIATGKGNPNGKDKPQTDDERKLSAKS